MTKEQLRINFASNLRYIRKGLEMNQEQFATHIGIKRGNLASIEEGRSLSIETAISISQFIRISLDTLLLTNMSGQKGMVKYRAKRRAKRSKINPQ